MLIIQLFVITECLRAKRTVSYILESFGKFCSLEQNTEAKNKNHRETNYHRCWHHRLEIQKEMAYTLPWVIQNNIESASLTIPARSAITSCVDWNAEGGMSTATV